MACRFLITILLSLSISLSGQTQTSKHTIGPQVPFQKYAVGLSVSSFANQYPGIQLSQDFRLRKTFNLASEVAILFGSNLSGYRFKIGVEQAFDIHQNYFFAFGIHYLRRETRQTLQRNSSLIPLTTYRRKVSKNVDLLLNGAEIRPSVVLELTNRVRLQLGAGMGLGQCRRSQFLQQTTEDYAVWIPFFFSYTEFEGNETADFTRSKKLCLITSLNINFSYAIWK